MSTIRKLAGQTAIYGVSSMLGRFVNYLLTFLHTRILEPQQYGVVNGMFAYTAFLLILFTYGMETALFRFASKDEHPVKESFSTAMRSIMVTSTFLCLLMVVFRVPLCNFLGFEGHSEFIAWFAVIMWADSICAIPLVKLRIENRPVKFAAINLTKILTNVFFNIFFLVICPYLLKHGFNWVSFIYNQEHLIAYVFISNLISSILGLVLVFPALSTINLFNKKIWKSMLWYALPLLPMGMAGMVNEVLDRILLLRMIPDHFTAQYQTGIYGANYKFAMLMTLFVQAYRYAAEPFFFAEAKKQDARQKYASIMNYFVIACCVMFMSITFYIDIIKHLLGKKEYYIGLTVVPILLLANMFNGIYINLSIWFKLSDQTRFGLFLTGFGAIITIVLNIIWIPVYGYIGCAWATLICYSATMILCYILGQKYYPVPYKVFRILGYISFTLLLFFVSNYLKLRISSQPLYLAVNGLLICAFATLAFYIENGKKLYLQRPE